MGLDFLKRAGKSFQKGWDRGRDELATPDLFTRHPECRNRFVVAKPHGGQSLSAGEKLILQKDGSRLIVCRAASPVATVLDLPQDLAHAIHESGGYACGYVERVHARSGVADISIS